jgi:hypothetical protein
MGGSGLGWLALAGLGIIWGALLLWPVFAGRRPRTAKGSVNDFEHRMGLLAQAEVQGSGRWIVTPRKGMPFVGTAERRRSRARGRRKQIFTFLLESIVITFLIGVVPPLRVMWTLSLGLVGLLVVYVWLLLAMKHRDAGVSVNDRERAARAPASPRLHRSADPRYVAEGRSTWARPTFNGLGALGESDRVHVVVRVANPA